MEYINIGKIWDTHGIKGEVRILLNDVIIYDLNNNKIISYDEMINLLFKNNKDLYIGYDYKNMKIVSYRHHKIYEMVCFEGINNINDVLIYKKQNCYVDKNILSDNLLCLDDLVGYDIICNEKNYGKIVDYQNNNGNIVIKISFDKDYFIPLNANFITGFDKENKMVYTENIEGLII